jgi:hypothetical protein
MSTDTDTDDLTTPAAAAAGGFNPNMNSSSSSDLDKAKLELETLQTKAVFSLMEFIPVEHVTKKLLYLSNKQADMIDLSNVEKFLIAFEIPISGPLRPKLVINLFESSCRVPVSAYDGGSGYLTDIPRYKGEESIDKLYETDEKIALFLRNKLLPLAIETNAIIILATSGCSLSRMMSAMCSSEAATRQGGLPFTVIQFATASDCYVSSQVAGSVGYALKTRSQRWNDAEVGKLWLQNTSIKEKLHIGLPVSELLAGASHYVICDGRGSFILLID